MMLAKVRHFFASPIFEDPDKTRLARILNGFGWAVIVIMLVLIVNRISTQTWVGGSTSYTFPLVVFIILIMQFIIRIGYVHFAGRFAVTLIWITMTYQASQADGLWDVALISHLAVILLAALMLGWREGVVVGAFSLVAIWYFAYQHYIGLHEFKLDPPLNYARDLTAVFVITSVLIYYLVYIMNRSLAESNVELKERLRAESKLQLQADYLTALHETTLGLVNRLELNPLLESIIARASDLLNTSHVAIDLVLPDESTLKQVHGFGIFAGYDGEFTPKGKGLIGKVWQSGTIIHAQDYNSWEGRDPEAEYVGFGAVLGAPLKSGSRVIGVLTVATIGNQKDFTAEQVIIMERLATLASIAIDNARLYQEAQIEIAERKLAEEKIQLQAEYLTALHETALGLVNRLELNPLLESIIARASDLLGTENVALDLVLQDGSALRQEIGLGKFAPFNGTVIGENVGASGKAWKTGKTVVVKQYEQWDEKIPHLEGTGFAIVACVPLKSGNKVIGILAIASTEAREFTQEQLILLERFAALASIAIDNARLYQEAQTEIIERKLAEEKLKTQAQYLNALNETTLGLVNRLELNPLLESIIARASDLLDTEEVALHLVLPDDSALKQEIGNGKFSQFNEILTHKSYGVIGNVWASGKSMMVENYSQWSGRIVEVEGIGFESVICAPLKSGATVIGVIVAAHIGKHKKFTEEELTLLEKITALASIAIDNARLYQEAQTEILERKIIETELRASDERFRKVFNNNKVAISIVTLEEGIFLEANEAFWQITGLTPEKALGHSALEFNLWKKPEDRAEFVKELTEKGSLSNVEVVFPTSRISLAYYELINLKNQLCIVCLFYDITELRQAERAFKESEERFRKVFQASPVAICITTLEEGRLLDANQAYWNLTEYSVEESLGKTAQELDMWNLTEDRKKFVNDIKAKRSLTNPNYQFLTYKTHQPRSVIAFYELIELREQTGILSMFYDVTEQRQIQEALRNAESRTRAILESMPDMIFEISKEGVFLDYVASTEITPLVPPSEFIGKNVNQFFPEHIVEQTLFSLERAIATEQLHAFEYELTHEGETRFFEARISPVTDETAIVMVRDISQRKWVETEREKLITELENKNAESETLRESVSIVVETLDKSEAIDRILEQLEKVIPYNSASVQLLDENMLEIVSTRGLEPKSEHIGMRFEINDNEPANALLHGEAPYVLIDDVQVSTSVFTEDMHSKIHAWMAIPLRVKGQLIGIIALDGYTTGQFTEKDAELALTYANQVAIAIENARLFSELQNELVERKRLIEELESKNTELERFTYTVSHDLKSPLITIKGFLGFLEQDAMNNNQVRLKSDIQRISEATSKMQTLLGDLLNLSRVGRLVQASEYTPFNEIISEALEIVHGRLMKHEIRVRVHPNLPTVYVDRPRIVEVMQNLIDNAAKFIKPEANPLIEIGQNGYDESGKPIFFVQDNGIGIDEAHHERIFGLFNKLDAESEGTGVGLALVKRIIELHGGRIWIESKLGKGATFYFTLPTHPPE
ncbi:MAG: GAF domain-containing protein [Anaerolineales bacterium]|nr:GAF domain-containing protein [Anaerolineales bacterium]